MLEHLGFTVISEHTHELEITEIGGGERRAVILHDMEIATTDGKGVSLEAESDRITEAILSIWHGRIDSDGFNRLVVGAGLAVREAMVLRAIARYLRQAGLQFPGDFISDALARYPAIASKLFELFRTRFDLSLDDDTRRAALSGLTREIEDALMHVPNQDDDRIFRRFENAITSMLRTSYFQTDEDGNPRPALAFKLDPQALDGLPEPRPYREIFVYGAEVEGVHLRFGPVARGGLRWSDRSQDYRTEVLGLVKAQQVKKAVIVPGRCQGWFSFPKRLPGWVANP